MLCGSWIDCNADRHFRHPVLEHGEDDPSHSLSFEWRHAPFPPRPNCEMEEKLTLLILQAISANLRQDEQD